MGEWIDAYPGSPGWVNIKDAKFVLEGKTLVWDSFWKYFSRNYISGRRDGKLY